MGKSKDNEQTKITDMEFRAQWNKNRERYQFVENAIRGMAQFFGVSLDKTGGVSGYDADLATFKPPQPAPVALVERKNNGIDLDRLGRCIATSLDIGDFISLDKPKIVDIRATATVDDSVHIGNNKSLMDRISQDWASLLERMCSEAEIIREIKNDGSVVYRIDKEGRKKRTVDKEEQWRIEYEKKQKWQRHFIDILQNVKHLISLYILVMALCGSLFYNYTLRKENTELTLTKKEYQILRWHANSHPTSRQFMHELDSFVQKEGISPVYDRVVESMKEDSKNKDK